MKKKRRPSARHGTYRGFDYGIGIPVAAVGSIEFKNNLVDAEVVAVAYGDDYSKTLGVRVPAITLIGRNEEPLRKAFEEFSNWVENTDADAIELTMVFEKDGGYTLCINPEISALYKRALKYDTVANPMAIQVMWIKVIEATSQALLDLREVLSAGIIRPFLLRAARYNGILQVNNPLVQELIEPISHREELLKFDIRFVDRGSKEDLHWQRLALGEKGDEKTSVGKNRTMPRSMVWDRRSEALKRLFPVTLWRSRSLGPSIELRSAAKARGLSEWQVDQAICNLVLSKDITDGKLHFEGCSKSEWVDRFWESLTNRFEVSGVDQEDFAELTVGAIVRQAILDARILLEHYGVKRAPNRVERIQYLLRKHELLSEPKE